SPMPAIEESGMNLYRGTGGYIVKPAIRRIWGAFIVASATLAQSPIVKPAFDLADVHASARFTNAAMQGGVLRNGRFEIRHATMLDLIKTAYKVDPDTVFGGPEWLDRHHFDVIAT